jgi:hypothetical protein
MRTLEQEEFLRNTRSLKTKSGNWASAKSRWLYHKSAIAQLRQLPTTPERVLELGAFGAQLVPGSHTMDYQKAWNFAGNRPTHWHDAREIPWPIDDGAYDWFVALRVFHHLRPGQEAAFREALRVARNVLIVVPEHISKPGKRDQGITREQFRAWQAPAYEEEVGNWGRLYVWHQ